MASDTKVGRFLDNLRNTLKDHRGESPRRVDRKAAGGSGGFATPPTVLPPQHDIDTITPSTSRTRIHATEIDSISAALTTDAAKDKGLIRFNWRMARAFVQLRTQPANSFSHGGLPFFKWTRTKIPTLGASPASCRVQEMYTVTLPDTSKVFVKIVPIKVWTYQWHQENEWDGEFTTDGENFVMEAAALAFLHEYAPTIAPRLVAVLEVSGSNTTSRRTGSKPGNVRRSDDAVTHMAIVSELYGEDLLDYLDRRDRKNTPLNEKEKRALQIACVLLLRQLHSLGLAHLDFTPENILIGNEGLRLCDFAKATPICSRKLRHMTVEAGAAAAAVAGIAPIMYPFESCEPTVGKGAYMPPECWKIYWRLEHQRILRPLEDLAGLRSAAERVSYYFKVCAADIYMIGVVLFWIWSDGGVWKCSDAKQDEKYYHLSKGNMNLDLFRECRSWPPSLKECLKKILTPEPWRRLTMEELLECDWINGYVDGDDDYLAFYSGS